MLEAYTTLGYLAAKTERIELITWVTAAIYREPGLLAKAPVPGHSGYERVELGEGSLATGGYAHYLHHKYFEVNYADGAIPLDRWFGSFHDGSPEAGAAMRRRRIARSSA